MSKFVLTAQLQLQAPKNVRKVVSQIQSQLQNVNVNVAVKNAAQSNKQLKNLSNSANQASNSFQNMGKSLNASIRRFTGLAIATRAVSLFTNTLGNAIREAIDFERELVKVSQVTGKTVAQLQSLTNTIGSLSTSLGVSSTSLLSVSRILAQTGLSARDTQTALATLARTELAPTFDNITQTAEGAVAILNQFGQGAAALEAQLGSLNAVAGQFAVESGDLIAVIRRTGGVFKAAGGDLNELIALFTSVRATTRESAESISTGLRTIFTRIQRPETIEYLRQFGVELVDLQGKFVGPFEAIRQLSAALAGLEQGDITFIEIAEQLGGFRQIGKVIPLLQQFAVAQAALNVAQEGSGSLATDAAKAQAALAIQITKVKEEFLSLIRSVTSSTTFQVMADTVLKLTSALLQLADALAPIIPLLGAFAGAKLLGSMGKGAGKMFGFNKGGKVLHFARGGMVPGTGNRDTVPAMLQPGEFVIKKSSVEKLGSSTLSAMNENRFNRGMDDRRALTMAARPKEYSFSADPQSAGKGQGNFKLLGDINAMSEEARMKLAAVKSKYTGAFLRPEARDQVVQGTLEGKPVRAALEKDPNFQAAKKLAASNPQVLEALQRELSQIDAVAKGVDSGFTLYAGSLEKNAAEAMEGDIVSGVRDVVQRNTATIGGNLGLRSIPDQGKILKQANISQVAGNVFEAILLSAGAKRPYDEADRDASADFDFPTGLGPNIAANFGLSPYAGRPGDAKSTFNPKNVGSFNKKVKNFETQKAQEDVAAVLKDNLTLILGQLQAQGTDIGLPGTEGRRKALNLPAGSKGRTANEILKAFASGGPAGPDTVPALLTPGEFVVNRKSAQKIGYDRLGKMNKVAKFNKGGSVGDIVQRFENGGTAQSIDFSGINSGLNNTIKSFNNSSKSMLAFARITNTATQAVANQLTVSGQMSAATNQRIQASLRASNASIKSAAGAVKQQGAAQAVTAASNKQAAAQNAAIASIQGQGKAAAAASTGLSGMMGGLFAVQMLLSQMQYDIDETSGVFQYMFNGASQLAMQLTVVATLLESEMAQAILSSAAAHLNLNISMASLSTSMAVATGVVGLLVAGLYLFLNATIESAEAAKKRAIEDGNVDEAGKQAVIAANAKVAKTTLAMGIAVAAVTVLLYKMAAAQSVNIRAAGLFGIGIGVAVAGAALFAAGLTAGVDSVGLLARAAETAAKAEASLEKSSKVLADSQKDATDAMKEFKKGTIDASEALARSRDAAKAVAETQAAVAAANRAASASVVNFGSVFGSILKAMTFGMTNFGFEDVESAQTRTDSENKARSKEAEKQAADLVAQNQPAINALAKQTTSAGGSFADFMRQLQATNPELARLADQGALHKAFLNIQKEAARTAKAFEAMNLGFQGVNAAATAMSVGVNNLVGRFDGSISEIDATIATLQAGVSNAAQGMGAGVFEQALDTAASKIERLGGDATKFRQNMLAINQAQKFFVSATAEAKDNLMAEFKRGAAGAGTAGDRREAFADAVIGQMDGVGDEVKSRIRDALAGAEISNEDLNAIMEGRMDVLDKVMKDLGDTTLNQVLPALQELAKTEKALAEIQTRRLALEDKFISSIQKQIDVTLEAAEIMAEFGGAAVSPADRRGAIVGQLNASGAALGLSQMRTGSADEIRQRNREISSEQSAMQETRMRAAQGDAKAQNQVSDPAFKAREERLKKAAEENYRKTKELIDVKRQEIKVIEAKNAAEKKAADALLGGNIEEFMDQMAGKGAATAAALGSPQLAAQFGVRAFGTANEQLQGMQDAGATSFMGMNISAARQNAVGFGAMNAGMGFSGASSLAQAATGTSPEAQAVNAAARDLASTLPQSTANLSQATAHMYNATLMMERTAMEERDSAVANVDARSSGTGVAGTGGTSGAGATGGTGGTGGGRTGGGTGGGGGGSRGSGGGGGQADSGSLVTATSEAASKFQAAASALGSKLDSLSSALSTNVPSFAGLENAAGALATFQENFSATVDRLAATTISVQVAPTTVNVNLNGGEMLANLSQAVRQEIMGEVTAKLGNLEIKPDGTIGQKA